MITLGHHQLLMSARGSIACGLETGYSGGEAFPSEFSVTLGPGLGGVLLEYATSGLPDKIEIWVSGAKVLDTGYVGDVSNQAALDSALADRGLPSEPIRQRAGSSSVADDWANPQTREYAAYYKATTSAQATVKVYAPLSGTAWRMKLHCPDGYAYQVFSDSDDFVVPLGVTEVDAFLVAGGGGSRNKAAGNFVSTAGAGAGGVLEVIGHSVTPLSSMPIVIGEGGVSGNLATATRGGDTTFDGQVAVGGGIAGTATYTSNQNGGSGGGVSWTATPGDGVPGSGVDGQGHDGGKSTGGTDGHKTGGGGGSKSPGSNGSVFSSGGAGGDGHSLAERGWGPAIAFGAPVAVGGGGGGGVYKNSGTGSGGKGGYGGGGDGGGASSSAVQNGSNGVDGTGGGGGGAGGNGQTSGNASLGGNGGKGIAIIRWKIS